MAEYGRWRQVTGAKHETYDALVVCINDKQGSGQGQGGGKRVQCRIEGHMDNLGKIPDGPQGGMPWWPVAGSTQGGSGKGNHGSHNLTPGDMVRVQLDGPHGTVLYTLPNDQNEQTHHPNTRGKDKTVSQEDYENGTYGFPMRYDEVMKNESTMKARQLRDHKLYSKYNKDPIKDRGQKDSHAAKWNKNQKKRSFLDQGGA